MLVTSSSMDDAVAIRFTAIVGIADLMPAARVHREPLPGHGPAEGRGSVWGVRIVLAIGASDFQIQNGV